MFLTVKLPVGNDKVNQLTTYNIIDYINIQILTIGTYYL